MLLHQRIINNSIQCCLCSGVVWCSSVYHIITNSKHYITSITPLYQYFYILYGDKKESIIFSPIYVVCLDFWCSGVTTIKSSLLLLKRHYTKLHRTTPEQGPVAGVVVVVPSGVGSCL